eukprot:TRINITY_DN93027_c0_g1_i1.p1 TRINITY_DN93027_c0_g1~~TRINITY_DN93027_c0_g1_i1.p1  ORF type:complete len:379 (+),score=34.11 TRINITY_DN93027_c0_g1_i1:232-1368(+)
MRATSRLRQLWDGNFTQDIATVRVSNWHRYLQPCVGYGLLQSSLREGLNPLPFSMTQREEMKELLQLLEYRAEYSEDEKAKIQKYRKAWMARPPVRRCYIRGSEGEYGVGTAFHIAPEIAIANDHGIAAPDLPISLSNLSSNTAIMHLDDAQREIFPKGKILTSIRPPGTNYDCSPWRLDPAQELRFLATSNLSPRILIPSARLLKKENLSIAMLCAGFCLHLSISRFAAAFKSIQAKNDDYPTYSDYTAAFPANVLTLSPCKVKSITRCWFHTDGSMTGGHCGSPLLYFDDPECFAGIYSGANSDTGENFFWAVTDPVFIANWCQHALPHIAMHGQSTEKAKAFVRDQQEAIENLIQQNVFTSNVVDTLRSLMCVRE